MEMTVRGIKSVGLHVKIHKFYGAVRHMIGYGLGTQNLPGNVNGPYYFTTDHL